MAEALFPAAPPVRTAPKPLTRKPCALALPYGAARRVRCARSTAAAAETSDAEADSTAMSIDALHRFIDLNLGKWNGSFYQFDSEGNALQTVSTRLSASSYGDDELISLMQTLYIQQPPSRIYYPSNGVAETEWTEYKIKETNMFTVDKYQQIGFFADERAFSLRYQTAGMLETVLRAGVLGEDDIDEESPKNLKIPSRRPSVVCENVIYSLKGDRRARAFQIMDPKGLFDTLLIFLEGREKDAPFVDLSETKDSMGLLSPVMGKWEGHSVTKRSGLYGATLAEADTIALLEIDEKGRIIQDITSVKSDSGARSNVHWRGSMNKNSVIFDGGFQMTLLPGGMFVGYPSDIGKIVSQSQSFHLEFCWMESPQMRQRLVRTYDVEGQVVSSTYFRETKV